MILPILKSSLETLTGAASAAFFPPPFSALGLDDFSFFFESVVPAAVPPVAPLEVLDVVVVVEVLVGVSTFTVVVDDS